MIPRLPFFCPKDPLDSIQGTCPGIHPVLATEWRRHRNKDIFSPRGKGKQCKRRKGRGNRKQHNPQRQVGQGCPGINKLPSRLVCPPGSHLRPGSQPNVRCTQFSLLVSSAPLSPSLAHPRAGARKKTETQKGYITGTQCVIWPPFKRGPGWLQELERRP